MRIILVKIELISNAPNGLDDPFVRYACKLFAQALDMYVNGTRVTEIVKSPDLVKKLIACKYSVIVGSKEIEKLKLLGGNVDIFAAELELVFLKADLDILKSDDLVVCLRNACLTAAENCLYSCRKLLVVNRLYHIVVSAELKTEHLVKDLALCACNDDRL